MGIDIRAIVLMLLYIPLLQSRGTTASSHTHRVVRIGENPLEPAFEDYVNSLLDDFHVPGLSVGVVSNGSIFTEGYGWATLGSARATSQTMYATGSTTKSFTAAALSLMINDSINTSNPLSWQTPISSVLKEDFVLMSEYTTLHATFEDLASHRTGMPRHDGSGGGANSSVRDVTRSLRWLPLTAELREVYQYCNLMYMVLSHAVETLTGGIWLGDTLRSRIWEPLGMNHTFLRAADAMATDEANVATGYIWYHDTNEYVVQPIGIEDSFVSGAGAMISTVGDYARYLRAMIDESAVLPADFHSQIRRPRSYVSSDHEEDCTVSVMNAEAYSLGWDVDEYQGYRYLAHDGSVYGFGASMIFFPDRKWGAVVLANSDDSSSNVIPLIVNYLVDQMVQEGGWSGPNREATNCAHQIEAHERQSLLHSRSLIYEEHITNTLRHSLSLLDYTGTYTHPGHLNVTLDLIVPPPLLPLSNRNTTSIVLHAYIPGKFAGLYFEHVNAEHFLVWVNEFDRTEQTPSTATKAEFYIDHTGVAARLGLALEPAMGDQMLWFNRVAVEPSPAPLQVDVSTEASDAWHEHTNESYVGREMESIILVANTTEV